VSTAGGTLPRWRSDGKELFYIALDDWVTAVPILGSDGQSLRISGHCSRTEPPAGSS
jgi:hypothetical protein